MDLVHVDDLLPARVGAWRPGDAFLAGGTWLFSEPQPGLTRLLDLTAFEWPDLVALDDGGVELAATCSIARLATWADAPPIVRQCCEALLGSFKVWNAATVGGNICLALPAGPMTSLVAALDGTCLLWAADGSTRELPVADVVVGPRQTALRPGELLRSVRLPGAALRSPVTFRQMSLSTYGRSAALVTARVAPDGTVVVVVTASTPRPVRVVVPAGTDAVRAVTRAVQDGPGWYDDVHGDPRWRAAMTARLVAESVDELGADA